MRPLLTAALLLAPCVCRAGALPPEFAASSVNGAGIISVKAATTYVDLVGSDRADAVAKVGTALGLADGPLSVRLPDGGELWNLSAGKAEKLDSWSGGAVQPGPGVSAAGRWFASLGMQNMGGGDYPASTLNMRVGSTLFRGRYDLALSYDYYKPRDSELTSRSLGIVGRALMPLSRHSGWNAGAQLSTSDNYGVKTGDFGLVAGINVYLPRGSFDISLNLKGRGACGLLLGYTVYLTR
mgnify:CR=1 FL=1